MEIIKSWSLRRFYHAFVELYVDYLKYTHVKPGYNLITLNGLENVFSTLQTFKSTNITGVSVRITEIRILMVSKCFNA